MGWGTSRSRKRFILRTMDRELYLTEDSKLTHLLVLFCVHRTISNSELGRSRVIIDQAGMRNQRFGGPRILKRLRFMLLHSPIKARTRRTMESSD